MRRAKWRMAWLDLSAPGRRLAIWIRRGHVIIDRETARFFWGPENPIGRRFRLDPDDDDYPWLTVVGVVEDIKLMGQDDRQGSMDIFYPLPPSAARSFMSLVMRTGETIGVLVVGVTLDYLRAKRERN